MDLRRLKPVDWLTGFFGAALVGLLWAPWYRALDPSVARILERLPHGGFFAVRAGHFWAHPNAWQSLAINDVILFIVGLLGIGVVVATASYSTAAVPIAAAVFATFGGLLAFLLALIRLVFPPDLGFGPTHRAAGAWFGTAAALGLAVSAALTMRNERRSAPGTAHVPVTELPAPRVSGEGTRA